MQKETIAATTEIDYLDSYQSIKSMWKMDDLVSTTSSKKALP